MKPAGLTGLLLACWVSVVRPQEPAAWIRGPSPSLLFATPLADSTRVPRPTYWKEGLMIGGGIGALGLGYLVSGLCLDGDSSQKHCLGNTIAGAALGAVTGGTIGALIGGQFPKQTDTLPAPDSTVNSPEPPR